jgi:hypothetical protein
MDHLLAGATTSRKAFEGCARFVRAKVTGSDQGSGVDIDVIVDIQVI